MPQDEDDTNPLQMANEMAEVVRLVGSGVATSLMTGRPDLFMPEVARRVGTHNMAQAEFLMIAGMIGTFLADVDDEDVDSDATIQAIVGNMVDSALHMIEETAVATLADRPITTEDL